jgi:Spy/CpxP family protein refolding chaperone
MKSILAVFVALAMSCATTAIAQTASDTNMEILKEKLKADKKLIVAGNMDLTEKEAKDFWPVYDSYQKELQQVNQRLRKTIMDYAEAYKQGPVPDSTAQKLVNEALSIEEQEVKLKRTYAGKLAEVLPKAKAARYIQIENKIRALLKAELAQNIPLVY